MGVPHYIYQSIIWWTFLLFSTLWVVWVILKRLVQIFCVDEHFTSFRFGNFLFNISKPATVFSKVAVISPTTMLRGLQFHYILTCCFQSLVLLLCEVLAHCGFNLHCLSGEQLFPHVLNICVYKPFDHFEIAFVCHFVVSWVVEVLLHILEMWDCLPPPLLLLTQQCEALLYPQGHSPEYAHITQT